MGNILTNSDLFPQTFFFALQIKDCVALCEFFAWIEREVHPSPRPIVDTFYAALLRFSDDEIA